MANQITNIVPTTELEAVNAMLSAVGLSPVAQSDVDNLTSDDVSLAVNFLRNATREVLTRGWKFNSTSGVEIAPTANIAWTDSSGQTTTLNIFKKPAGILSWRTTECLENSQTDLMEFLSLRYRETGNPVLVLYDRLRNRDGIDQQTHPFLYLDLVYALDFAAGNMPEEARWYIVCLAARTFVQYSAGEQGLAKLAGFDQEAALSALSRKYAIEEDTNIFDTVEAFWRLGGRPRPYDYGMMRPVYRQ